MHKHGLKILGLALMAAAGLMAFSATSALAVDLTLGDKFYEDNETAPKLLVNNGTGSPTGLTTRAIKGIQIGTARFAVPGKKIEVVCKKGELNATGANEYENLITGGGAMKPGAHANGTLVAKECTTEEMESMAPHNLTGVKLTACVPNFDAPTPGEVEAKLLLLGKKHNGVPYIVAVPQVTSKASAEANEALTSAFTTIKYDIDKCSAVQTAKVTGSASFKTPTTDSVKPILKINTLVEDKLIGTKLKFGANAAFIEAEVEAELPTNPSVIWGVM